VSGVLKINGEVIAATHFAYDGCHKIYLIGSDADMETMRGYGYGEDSSDILPVSELEWAWGDSCSLRFIHWADLHDPDPVSQCYETEPVIEWVPAIAT
jgi:hypothetical protein